MRKLIAIFLLALPLMGCGEPGSELVGKYLKVDTQIDPRRFTEVEFLKDGSGTVSSCCTMGGNRFTTTFTWSVPDEGRLRVNLTYYSGDKEEAIGEYSVSGKIVKLTNMGSAMTGSYSRKSD